VAQGRADWGLAIEPVARVYDLAFVAVRAERYDFAIPAVRWDRPAVAAFRELIAEPSTRQMLEDLGFDPTPEELV
jgi:putative molybdopterin biosynthesis protein